MYTNDTSLFAQEGLDFDPAKWAGAARAAGLRFELREDGWLVVDVLEAEASDAILFMGWLGEHHEELAFYLSETEPTLH